MKFLERLALFLLVVRINSRERILIVGFSTGSSS